MLVAGREGSGGGGGGGVVSCLSRCCLLLRFHEHPNGTMTSIHPVQVGGHFGGARVRPSRKHVVR